MGDGGVRGEAATGGAQANQMVEGLRIRSSDKGAAAEQIKALYNTFKASDCTMVEVCPRPPPYASPLDAQSALGSLRRSAC